MKITKDQLAFSGVTGSVLGTIIMSAIVGPAISIPVGIVFGVSTVLPGLLDLFKSKKKSGSYSYRVNKHQLWQLPKNDITEYTPDFDHYYDETQVRNGRQIKVHQRQRRRVYIDKYGQIWE